MRSVLATAEAALDDRDAPTAKAVIDALVDIVVVIDPDDVVYDVNPSAEQFFDAGAGHLRGRMLGDLIQFDSPLLDLVVKVRAGVATITEYNIELLSPRSPARIVDAQVTALPENLGWLVLSLRERTIADKLDRQLSHLGAGRSVAGLAAAMAHEVKNPLSGIRGAAQLLEANATPADQELTRLITEETDRICKLVDRMDMFSDGHSIERSPVNIHEVLDHVRRLAENGFARGLHIEVRYDPSLPAVSGDRDQLVQVFLNLVKNAAEATPERGGELVIATAFRPGVRLSTPGGESRLRLPLVVTIQDNGSGVPEALKPHLFEPFISGKASGVGLGLSLVAKIVGDHGGVVEFTSEPRRTAFHVLLPIHDAGGEG